MQNLTADQTIALGNGMRTAAVKYRECAHAMRIEKERQPASAAPSFERLAKDFDAQADAADALADIIENATDVQIID